MNVSDKALKELDKGIKKLENLIAHKGLGSSKLEKARKTQRNINLGLAIGGLVAIAGVLAWKLSSSDKK